MTRTLLIMGPTASGKSALALALAQELGGEIVNADSMQVYRDLRVLTARPSPEEEARAPHHLYGVIDAAERFSVGGWTRAVAPVLEDIARRGKRAIVVGGTGLFFMALTEGLAEIPEPDAALVADLRARAEREGAAALHRDLVYRDPGVAAALSPRDGPRIVRALSVLIATGRSIAKWRSATRPMLQRHEWLGVALAPRRAALYEAIGSRFDAMLAQGALEEARAIAARALEPTLPILKAHGLPWLLEHLRGTMPLEEAHALAVRDTRRYAKRQMTWIAHQTPDWPRLVETGLSERIEHVLALNSAVDGE